MLGEWIKRDDWWPASRGRSWEFTLPTTVIVEVLDAVAAKRDDAFSILQCERVQSGGEWWSTYRELPVESLTMDGPWQYFIRSRTLNPAIPAPAARSGVGWPAEFSMNGLILLHHPDPVRRDARASSSIGIMHRVGNERTGEVREHTDADAMFATLKRALRSAGASRP